MKRLLLVIAILCAWVSRAAATPVLTVQGVCTATSVATGAWNQGGLFSGGTAGAACVAVTPSLGDLEVTLVTTTPGATVTGSGTNCASWTNHGELIAAGSGRWVLTQPVTSTSAANCTWTPSPIGDRVFNTDTFFVHESDGNSPVYDTGCGSDLGAVSSGTGCTLTTARNGEIILDYADAFSGSDDYTFIGPQATGLLWGSNNCHWFGCATAWQGQGASGTSTGVQYTKNAATNHMQTFAMAVAANDGSGGKADGYVFTNIQPNGNNSVGAGMTLPYCTSSPCTVSFPSGSVVGGTVVANIMCGNSTCGTITPPPDWSASSGTPHQIGPSLFSEADVYCHTYTGTEGTQTWTFTGSSAASFFVQYAASNVPNGRCFTNSATATNSVPNLSYTSPTPLVDSLWINASTWSNAGAASPQLFASNAYYGTIWGTCQLGGTCDHEGYHVDGWTVPANTSRTESYSTTGAGATSIVLMSTVLSGTSGVAAPEPLWPFP